MASGQANAEILCDRRTAITLLHEQPIVNGVRRLTPVECERLQGFPDDWTGNQSDSARYRQLGNAVTVNVAEWIGRKVVE
jgi:site-specific DNA-cytosine methylase